MTMCILTLLFFLLGTVQAAQETRFAPGDNVWVKRSGEQFRLPGVVLRPEQTTKNCPKCGGSGFTPYLSFCGECQGKGFVVGKQEYTVRIHLAHNTKEYIIAEESLLPFQQGDRIEQLEVDPAHWSCVACTFQNRSSADTCRMCETAQSKRPQNKKPVRVEDDDSTYMDILQQSDCIEFGEYVPVKGHGIKHDDIDWKSKLEAGAKEQDNSPEDAEAQKQPRPVSGIEHTKTDSTQLIHKGRKAGSPESKPFNLAPVQHPSGPSKPSGSPRAVPVQVLEPKEEKKEESENDEDADDECVICLDGKTTYAIVPCGHKCLCGKTECHKSCGGVGGKCPICREDIMMIMKVFRRRRLSVALPHLTGYRLTNRLLREEARTTTLA